MTADQRHAFWHRFHLTKKGKRARKGIPRNTSTVCFTYWFPRTVSHCVNLVSRWPWFGDVLLGHNITFSAAEVPTIEENVTLARMLLLGRLTNKHLTGLKNKPAPMSSKTWKGFLFWRSESMALVTSETGRKVQRNLLEDTATFMFCSASYDEHFTDILFRDKQRNNEEQQMVNQHF